jgi:hypothetical protein
MTQAKSYTISRGVDCTVPFDTYICVQMSSSGIKGKFIGKRKKDTQNFEKLYPYTIEFEIFAMDDSFNKSCYSSVVDDTHTLTLKLLCMDAIDVCREFLSTDVPLIISWWMYDKFKQEVFGL